LDSRHGYATNSFFFLPYMVSFGMMFVLQLAVRRQQLENWRNQQELQASQRAKIQQMDSMTGDDGRASTWKKGARSYMDNLSGGAPAVSSHTYRLQ
jgi:hypothetical protein